MKNLSLLFFLLILASCSSPVNEEISTHDDQDTLFDKVWEYRDFLETYELTGVIQEDVQSPILSEEPLLDHSNLSALYRQLEKPTQKFFIDSDTSTDIVCQEGTKITIPGDAFITVRGEPVEGTIEFRTKEYYRNSDILMANLTTLSNGQYLESGGMIRLEAYADGQRLQLKGGKELKIAFPSTEQKSGMQMFNGIQGRNGINWIPRRNRTRQFRRVIYPITKVDVPPRYPGGQAAMHKYFKDSLFFPEVVLRKRIEGAVYVSFVVEASGEVTHVAIIRKRRPEMDKIAYHLVSNLPKFEPAQRNGKKVAVRFVVPIRFKLTKRLKRSRNRKMEAEAKVLEAKLGEVDVAYARRLPRFLETETEEDSLFVDYFERKFNDTNLRESDVDEVGYYLLSTSKLGWINCDRFWNYPDVGNMYVKFENSMRNADVKIIFKDIKSVLPGSWANQKFAFRNIPNGKEVTILAIQERDGQYFLAKQDLNTADDYTVSLKLEPVNMAQLKEVMKSFDT